MIMDRIEKRKIESELLLPLLKELETIMPLEATTKILMKVNEKEAFERGKKISQSGINNTINRLYEDVSSWGDGGNMEIDFIEMTKTTLHFNVKKCPYHELYASMGILPYGVALSCCRDKPFARGLNKNLELNRSKTLMEGDSHCDFRYTLQE